MSLESVLDWVLDGEGHATGNVWQCSSDMSEGLFWEVPVHVILSLPGSLALSAVLSSLQMQMADDRRTRALQPQLVRRT